MSIVFVGMGTATLGSTKRDKDGNTISKTEACWEADPDGGCVAVGKLNAETMRPEEEPISFFGDWDAAGYLSKVIELLKPRRRMNLPDIRGMIKRAKEDGVERGDVCKYCATCNGDCILIELWEASEEWP